MSNKKYPKAPITKGAAKVPVIMQLEALECGAASLAMIAAYYGLWKPLEQVRKDCGVSRDGSIASNIVKAARRYGFNAKGQNLEPEALKEKGTFPCIIHWNFNHFVVCCGFKGDKVYINDPARGNVVITMEEFDEAFTGICLLFEPNENFKPEGEKKNMVEFAKERLKGTGLAFALIIMTTVISSLIEIINPAFSRIFMDRLLTDQNPEWFYPFIVILSVLAVLQLAAGWVQAIYLLKIQGKFAIAADSKFMWHTLRLPVEFYSQRMVGDIASRQAENSQIANALISTFAPLIFDTAMLIFYFIVMLNYSLLLTAIGLGAMIINAIISQYISKKRVNLTRVQMRDSGKKQGYTVSGIEMIETIKASGAENGFFEKWAGYQASENDGNVALKKLDVYALTIPLLISSLSNIAILSLGVYLTMQGQFSAGMILAFQGLMTQFEAPAQKLTDAGQVLQEMRTSMERVDDVMKYPTDIEYKKTGVSDEVTYDKLSGSLELKNITFGYSRLAPPLISDFSLNLEAGKSVAFVGGSGSGKSTLSKLVSGLYKPWSGEILFNGVPIDKVDHEILTGSLAVVDQDITLFEDTIANNIKMWDNSIEDFEMIMAARDAQIHDIIMERDGGYQYKMLDGGADFSGGQRQRLEIARVLAQDPTIVIMDEATSALDAKTEYDVVRSIKDRGITMIVIAHRLSTIRDCDEIIVFDRGKVIERGKHEELMKLNGRYAELVTSE